MIGAITLRHEHLDWFAKQFNTRIAEHPLGLRVDHLDEAGRSDHHNRVWRRLHHKAEALLAFLERQLISLQRVPFAFCRHGSSSSVPRNYRRILVMSGT